jgi:hypothetical protein
VSLPAIVALGATQLGCGSSQEMRSARGVPASQGTVRATEGDNGNTNLSIRVKHLAPPQQIASEATVYVVWIHPRDFPRQNMGALVLSDDLEGGLDTVTPHRQFAVSITPEAVGTAGWPTNAPVFTADVDRT